MKKLLLLATAAFLVTGVAVAEKGKGKKNKKKCAKAKSCCSQSAAKKSCTAKM
jgi:hypothetical protein